MLDCLATHRLDKDQATNAAMGKTQYYLPLDKMQQLDIAMYHRLTTSRMMSYETYYATLQPNNTATYVEVPVLQLTQWRSTGR